MTTLIDVLRRSLVAARNYGDYLLADDIESILPELEKHEPVAWVDMSRWPPLRFPGGQLRCHWEQLDGFPLYISPPIQHKGWRLVRTDSLAKIAGMIDPKPIDLEDGRRMVFKNPMAADMLRMISEEFRAMLDVAPKHEGQEP